MKLTFVIRKYYPEYSGAAVQIALLIPRLIENGHLCRVVCFRTASLPDNANAGFNYPVVRLTRSTIPIIWRFVDGITLIWHEIWTEKPDVYVYYNLDYFIYMHLWFNKTFLRKFAIFVTALDPDTPSLIKKEKILSKWKLKILNTFDKIICIAPFIFDDYRKNGYTEKTLSLIPNSVDLKRFHPIEKDEKHRLREKHSIKPDAKVLLSVGRISNRKNQMFLCKILKNISHEKAILVLVGPKGGETKNDLENDSYSKIIDQYIIDNGLINKIKFVDTTINVHEWFQLSDIFVFASQSEGFGNVQIEAMACGLPSVVLRIPGVTDYIYTDRKDGYIINGEDILVFKQAIERLLIDTACYRYMAICAGEKVRAKFDISKIAMDYERVFMDL